MCSCTPNTVVVLSYVQKHDKGLCFLQEAVAVALQHPMLVVAFQQQLDPEINTPCPNVFELPYHNCYTYSVARNERDDHGQRRVLVTLVKDGKHGGQPCTSCCTMSS